MVPDRQKVWTDGWTEGAKTISLRLRLGIITVLEIIMGKNGKFPQILNLDNLLKKLTVCLQNEIISRITN